MNNNDLLILAKAMGKNAQKYMKSEPNDYVILFNEDLKKIGRFNPKKNNDQFLAVLKWLLTVGRFTSIDTTKRKYQGTVDFQFHQPLLEKRYFHSGDGEFESGLLDVAIQVAKELEK